MVAEVKPHVPVVAAEIVVALLVMLPSHVILDVILDVMWSMVLENQGMV